MPKASSSSTQPQPHRSGPTSHDTAATAMRSMTYSRRPTASSCAAEWPRPHKRLKQRRTFTGSRQTSSRTTAARCNVQHGSKRLSDSPSLKCGATSALESIELREALASLSRREQQLLWLVYAEGFSHKEVASIMKLSQASVRVLTFRARKKLKRVLVRERTPVHETPPPRERTARESSGRCTRSAHARVLAGNRGATGPDPQCPLDSADRSI